MTTRPTVVGPVPRPHAGPHGGAARGDFARVPADAGFAKGALSGTSLSREIRAMKTFKNHAQCSLASLLQNRRYRMSLLLSVP